MTIPKPKEIRVSDLDELEIYTSARARARSHFPGPLHREYPPNAFYETIEMYKTQAIWDRAAREGIDLSKPVRWWRDYWSNDIVFAQQVCSSEDTTE